MYGNGPWLTRAIPALAHSARLGPFGKCMALTGRRTACAIRLDQRQVGQTRNEEAVGASVGIGLAALDRLVGQRRVMASGGRLQEQIGAQR